MKQGDALIVVDVQHDFLPGGALAVEHGDEVVPVLNGYIERFERVGLPVVATRDWHPVHHCSFEAEGGTWPPHCVAETPGAAIDSGLTLPDDAHIVDKGTAADREAYSGFEGTDLTEWLREQGVRRVFVGGLATDYCVLNTVKDARAAGLDVVLLLDATRAVDARPGDGDRAVEEMVSLGAVPITLGELDSVE